MTKARDLANIISGGFDATDIPNLDTAKITSGTFADARLPATALNSNVDLTTLSATNLTSGTVADARLPATALNSNVDLTNLSASNMTSGTIPNARYGTPTFSGANLTNLPVSADFVKLASATDVNTSDYNVDGFFSSTYTNYMFIFNTVRSSNTANMRIRVNHGGSVYTGGTYRHAGGQAYRDSGGGYWDLKAHNWNNDSFIYSGDSHGNSKSGQLVVMLYDPLTTNGQHHITTDFVYMRGSDGATHQRVYSGCTVDDTTAVTGLRFFTGSGNFKADHFALYGMKA
jgi:hypothetical protein